MKRLEVEGTPAWMNGDYREASVLDLIASEVQAGGALGEEDDVDSLAGESVEEGLGPPKHEEGVDTLAGREEQEEEDEDDALGDLYAGLEETEEDVTETHRDLVKKLLQMGEAVSVPRRIVPRKEETKALEALYSKVLQMGKLGSTSRG